MVLLAVYVVFFSVHVCLKFSYHIQGSSPDELVHFQYHKTTCRNGSYANLKPVKKQEHNLLILDIRYEQPDQYLLSSFHMEMAPGSASIPELPACYHAYLYTATHTTTCLRGPPAT